MIDDIKELGSPLVGFTLDCGSMTSCVSPVCIQKFLDLGVPEENVRRLTDLWTTKPTLQQLMAEVNEIDGGPLVELLAVETWVYFGHGNPADLREAMPYIFHVHGKFFHVDDNGMDDAVRYPEIIDVLVETGYDGFISSEYEGHHWLKDKNAAGQVRAHQQYLQRLIDQSEARLSPVSAQT
jgi:sugar phosphate isomerase/epimerase